MSKRFSKFKYGSIKPTGWMLNQMRLHADGLLGNMDRVSKTIRESLWTGGVSNNYDDLPLWLQGFIPLAFALNDKEMKKRASFYLEKIIENNCNKWIKDDENFDIYSLFILMNTFLTYMNTNEPKDLSKYLYQMLQELNLYLDNNVLSQQAELCWFEAFPSILLVREQYKENWLDSLAKKLHCMGFDWIRFFRNEWDYDKDVTNSIFSEVLNNAKALRIGAYLAEYYDNPDFIKDSEWMHNVLNTYHKTCTGMISGDNMLAGKSSTAGIQLSALSEYMCSCAELMCSTGNVSFADRLEFLAFNPYPAAFSHDLWAFQPIQLANQVSCDNCENNTFSTAQSNARIFGIKGEIGYTPTNFCKGLPAYTQSCFLKTEKGIALTSYTPAVLETTIDDKPVKIECVSDYPFKENIIIKVTCPQPCTFDLELKIPEWAEDLRLSAGSDLYMPVRGTYHKFTGIWYDTTDINLVIKSSFKLERQDNELYAAVKGPLLFAIPLTEEKKADKNDPYADFELHTNDSYGYAFEVDYKDRFSKFVTYEEKNVASIPFSPSTPPIEMYTCGRRIQWPRKNGAPLPKPMVVPTSESGEMLRFIPYGATNLRMSQFPVLKK